MKNSRGTWLSIGKGKKHFVELSPQELNSFLEKEYSVGLFPFAEVVYSGLNSKPAPRRDLDDYKKRFMNLKKKIIISLVEFELIVTRSDLYLNVGMKNLYRQMPDSYEKQIIERYNLEPLFDINNDIEELIALSKPPKVIMRNYINLAWASILLRKNNKIDWVLIANLFDWFWAMLKKYTIYKELNPTNEESTDPDYLYNQYYKIISRFRTKNTARESSGAENLSKTQQLQPNKFLIVFTEKGMISCEIGSRLEENVQPEIRSCANVLDPKVIRLWEEVFAGKMEPDKISPGLLMLANVHYALKLYKDNSRASYVIIFPDKTYLIN
jgi:hypothetical protein